MFQNLPDWAYKIFWTSVSVLLAAVTTIPLDVGPEWTPVLTPVWNLGLIKVREYVDRRTSTASTEGVV